MKRSLNFERRVFTQEELIVMARNFFTIQNMIEDYDSGMTKALSAALSGLAKQKGIHELEELFKKEMKNNE